MGKDEEAAGQDKEENKEDEEQDKDKQEEDEEEEENDSTSNQGDDEVNPPEAPFPWAYDGADAVARDVEERHGPEFFPEGTHTEVDMPANVQHKIDSLFNQEPNVFGNCILIRDFAEPLRLGSSLIKEGSRLHHRAKSAINLDPHRHRHGGDGHLRSGNVAGLGVASLAAERGKNKMKKEKKKKTKIKLPDSLLLPKG